jgi:hypothetical protein
MFVAVGYFQPRGRFYLHQMLLPYLVQHFPSVPFSLAQSDPLRFRGPPRPPMKADIPTLHIKPDILILRRHHVHHVWPR